VSFFQQKAVGFDEKAFLNNTLVLFERTFDPVHVIAISIRHSSKDSIVAGSRVTKNNVWNAGDHFTDAEFVHRRIPPVRRFTPPQGFAETATKARKNSVFSLAGGQSAYTA